MESRIKHSCRTGAALVMVLIVTGIGLLFGAGALLLFRYQCQLRVDRQHELEKLYAVRSVLNWLRTYNDEVSQNGFPFSYYTGSGRDLPLLVKPVATRFPDTSVEDDKHFSIERGDFLVPSGIGTGENIGFYDSTYDYECGAEGVTNLLIRNTGTEIVDGDEVRVLEFYDTGATNGVSWWINIGLRNRGGWLLEPYGLRYQFRPRNYVGGSNADSEDIMQFCLIRDTVNGDKSGRSRGWPLATGEKALIFRIIPNQTGEDAEIEFFERTCVSENNYDDTTPFRKTTNNGRICQVGLQISDRTVSFFYIDTRFIGAASSRGYTFCGTAQLTDETYQYFKKGCTVDGSGRVTQAPNLRAVFVVNATSSARPQAKGADVFTKFKVTPAWQYDIFIEHPASQIQRATIAQKIGLYDDGLDEQNCTLLTYDTHGTENRGFRKDEREAARRQSGQ